MKHKYLQNKNYSRAGKNVWFHTDVETNTHGLFFTFWNDVYFIVFI